MSRPPFPPAKARGFQFWNLVPFWCALGSWLSWRATPLSFDPLISRSFPPYRCDAMALLEMPSFLPLLSPTLLIGFTISFTVLSPSLFWYHTNYLLGYFKGSGECFICMLFFFMYYGCGLIIKLMWKLNWVPADGTGSWFLLNQRFWLRIVFFFVLNFRRYFLNQVSLVEDGNIFRDGSLC